MRGNRTTAVVVMLVAAACSSGGTPATTPLSVPSTTTVATTTRPPTSTTTAVATTSTMDRTAEIEAIFQDLEERRLQALYDGDREAFQALFANTEYMSRSMGAFDVVEFVDSPRQVVVEVLELLADEAACIAANVRIDARQPLGASAVVQSIGVLELSAPGGWGYSYGGEGWTCDGPHPFS